MTHCLESIFQALAYVRLVIDDEQPTLHHIDIVPGGESTPG
jgi:hypothetical protein